MRLFFNLYAAVFTKRIRYTTIAALRMFIPWGNVISLHPLSENQ